MVRLLSAEFFGNLDTSNLGPAADLLNLLPPGHECDPVLTGIQTGTREETWKVGER